MADRKVYVEVKSRIIMRLPEGVTVSEVINEMDYNYTPTPSHRCQGVEFEDTEIVDHEVTDSK